MNQEYKQFKEQTKQEFHELETIGNVRLRVEFDDYSSIDDLAGDTFNCDANPDIPKEQMEREYKQFIRRVNKSGVWGIIGEYRCACCNSWVQGDSCWGFVGNDWKDSGYDIDIMAQTIDAYKKTIQKGD